MTYSETGGVSPNTTFPVQCGVTPGVVAVAWTLRHAAVTAAIVGFRVTAQVDGIIDAASLTLTDEDVREIEAKATG